jgi:RHS repeat-associated protein
MHAEKGVLRSLRLKISLVAVAGHTSCELLVRRLRMPRSWPVMAVVSAVGLTIALVPAGAASAAPARPVRPAVTPAAKIAAGEARPGHVALSQGTAGQAAARVPAGTVASPPSIPVGSGPVSNGTLLKFAISDKVSLQVNVGSGDALVTTSDIAIPEQGTSLTLGTSYNSLLTGSGVAQGAEGYGWRQREGVDVQLYPASSDGSVTLLGEDGTAGKFTKPASGSTYGSPAVFHATLSSAPTSTCSGSAYQLTWHQTGEVMCFTAAGLLTSEADRNGNTTIYAYNGSGQETSITYKPAGDSTAVATVTASYTGSYLTGLSQSGGLLGTRTITYTVNASTGNLTSVKQADGTLIQFGYDSSHDLTSVENGASLTTTVGYNSAHQVTSVTQPTTGTSTATTRLDYVSSTETQVATPDTTQSDPVPSVPDITYTIGSDDLVTQSTDQASDTTKAGYNGEDNVNSATGAISGENSSATYGNSGESMLNSQSPTGATSKLAYGNPDTTANPTAEFQPSSSTDAQANTTAYAYNGPGNLDQAQNAMAATAKVSYNSDGTPATSTNPLNGITNYGYNAAHQLTKVTSPTSGSLKATSITYDGFGRVATLTDGAGNTVTYTYDFTDRITKAAYTGGPHPLTVTYAYDGAGNLKTQTDPSGTMTYGHDGRNLVTSRTGTSGGGTLTYKYNGDGDLTSVADAGGTTTYLYNTRDLMYQMTDPAGNVWHFEYDADRRRTATFFDTVVPSLSTWAAKQTTGYDKSGRIAQIEVFENSNGSTPVSNISYCYSKFVSGQPCPVTSATTDTSLVQYSVNNLTGTVSQDTYDFGNRLTKETNVDGKTYSYGYDADGNLTSGAGAGSLAYNSSNQITTAGYSYDADGSLTATPHTGAITYNDAEQTTGTATSPSTNPETFTYAGAGQDQVLSDGSTASTIYGLSGIGGKPWVQSYTPANAGKAVYILHDQQGTPLGYISAGKDFAFLTDNLGSVTGIAATSGTTVASYSYDPYGQVTDGGEIGYTGALADPFDGQDDSAGIAANNWDHFGDRWYNPATGSFTTTDPQTTLGNASNGNAYAYAADNPANYTDPTGQDIWGDIAAGVLTAAGTAGAVVGVAVSLPVLTVVGAVVAVAGLGVYIYQMECKYGGAGSMWTMPGQCTVFG